MLRVLLHHGAQSRRRQPSMLNTSRTDPAGGERLQYVRGLHHQTCHSHWKTVWTWLPRLPRCQPWQMYSVRVPLGGQLVVRCFTALVPRVPGYVRTELVPLLRRDGGGDVEARRSVFGRCVSDVAAALSAATTSGASTADPLLLVSFLAQVRSIVKHTSLQLLVTLPSCVRGDGVVIAWCRVWLCRCGRPHISERAMASPSLLPSLRATAPWLCSCTMVPRSLSKLLRCSAWPSWPLTTRASPPPQATTAPCQ